MWQQAVAVALALLCQLARAQVVTVEGNAYQGLVVSISKDLQEALCDEYVQGIKNMLTGGSSLLHGATEQKLSFGEVTIVVPEGWTCQEAAGTSDVAWDEANLRVGPLHSVFGQNPWTQQPRGCGEPGDFMYFPESFLLENSTLGSRGSVFVHEWAKYRWGVFEEYGHRADPIFPSATRSYGGNETLRHTYCTDGQVAGDFYECDGDNLATCYFVPNAEETTGVTSSLLATPFLSSVVNFCNSETHVADVPTKHNLLCEKRSTWEVIQNHPDLTGTSSAPLTPPTFTVKQLKAQTTGNKLVFLLDVTKPMGIGTDTWNYLRDSVKEFILVEATDGMQVGLVSFTNTATKVSDLVTLDTPSNRELLAGKVPNAPSENTQTKDVSAGITKAKEVLGGEGMVILVTENMKSHSQDLVAAADGTPVWPVLYPHLIGVSYDIYQSLASAGGTSVFRIEDKVVDVNVADIQSIDNRVALSQCLLDIQYQIQGDSVQEIVNSSCAEKECQIRLEVPTNTNYQQTFHIEVYFTKIDGTYIKLTVRDPGGTNIGKSFNEDTGSVYTGTNLQAGTYIVDVSREVIAMDVKASLLATLQTESGGYDIKIWSSLDLQHLEYTSNSAPTLFAMVGDGDSHVIDARVTATVTDSGQTTAVLAMRDDGTGADVTGNDGVYSAYLIGLSQTGSASVQVAANDNGGSAKLVTATNRAAPVDFYGQSCCGSQITFQTELPSAGTFSLTSENPGQVTGTIPSNFPPGRVTDLRSSFTLSEVTLTFTAPGDDLDQGTAARYDVNFKRDDNNNITTYSSNITQEAGMLVTITTQLPDCDVLFHITVSATDSQSGRGKESNEVREMVTCSATETPPIDPPTPLGAGAIVGIVIGVILFLVILAIVIYLVMNRDNLDDLWLWQMLTCRCLRKPKNDNIYNPPAPRSTRPGNDVIRNNKSSSSGPVRSLDDLYAKPDLTAKRNKKTDEDDGDGGFGERRSRVNNTMAMNNLGDSASTASTSQPYMRQSNASINQVGLPPYSGAPNYGPPQYYGGNMNQNSGPQYDQQYDQYDGQYYDEFTYSPQNGGHDNAGYTTNYDRGYTTNYDRVPAPRKIKSNTQV